MLSIIKKYCLTETGLLVKRTDKKTLKEIQKEIKQKEGKEYSMDEIMDVWNYIISDTTRYNPATRDHIYKFENCVCR